MADLLFAPCPSCGNAAVVRNADATSVAGLPPCYCGKCSRGFAPAAGAPVFNADAAYGRRTPEQLDDYRRGLREGHAAALGRRYLGG